MFKNKFLTFIGLSIALSSCNVTKTSFENKLEIPTNYHASNLTILADTVKQASQKPQSWKSFYTDPILKSYIDTALKYNQDLKIAFQKIQMARAGVVYTKGIRLPDLNAHLEVGVKKFGDYTIDGVGNYDTKFSTNINDKQRIPDPVIPDYYIGFSTHWEADVWGKLKNKKRAAWSRFLSEQQGSTWVQTNLISEVALSYYNLMLLDEKLRILEENIMLQNSAIVAVEHQKEIGRTNLLAIELLTAQVLESQTMVMEVKQAIIQEETNLYFLLGTYPFELKRNTFSTDMSVTQVFENGVPSDLLLNRADIIEATHSLQACHADVKAAKAAFYPSITIDGRIGFQAFKAALTFDIGSFAFNALGGLVAPLLNRRALKAELLQASSSRLMAYLNYEKKVIAAFNEVYQLLKLHDNYSKMKEIKNNQVTLLKQSVETSRALFASGRVGFLEIITAQQNSLKSHMELLDIYRFENQNKVLLYKALGGGAE